MHAYWKGNERTQKIQNERISVCSSKAFWRRPRWFPIYYILHLLTARLYIVLQTVIRLYFLLCALCNTYLDINCLFAPIYWMLETILRLSVFIRAGHEHYLSWSNVFRMDHRSGRRANANYAYRVHCIKYPTA